MFHLSTDDLVREMDVSGAIELSDNQLKQLQNIILSLADDVIEICEDEGIFYTLSGGTFLGAVRHKGFIPWDDDMDFNVMRRDYDRLVRSIRVRLGDKCRVHAPEDESSAGFSAMRVELKGTWLRGVADRSAEECGVSIDFFVIENAPRNCVLRKLHEILCMGMGFALSCRRYAAIASDLIPRLEKGSDAARALKLKVGIGILLSFAPLSSWTRWCDRAYSLCRDGNSPFVVIPSGRRHYSGEIYSRSVFEPAKRTMFEGRSWCAPGDCESYLTALYGPDYMVPPPPEKRERHLLYEFDLGPYGSELEEVSK